MESKAPSVEEIKADHAAESEAISDKIAQGYDFKEEMDNNIFRSILGDPANRKPADMIKDRRRRERPLHQPDM